ncbi:MAG: hypothetical protein HXX14_09375 [Bacteroidetes bacterium]|nr:hypothetical protein [Bacteroidota bacterium]
MNLSSVKARLYRYCSFRPKEYPFTPTKGNTKQHQWDWSVTLERKIGRMMKRFTKYCGQDFKQFG